MKDFVETEICSECLFYSLCKTVNLPHCECEDYVKDRGKQQ